jgi:hypothetical protein
MRRGRCESLLMTTAASDYGREALALLGHGYSDDRSGSENLTGYG